MQQSLLTPLAIEDANKELATASNNTYFLDLRSAELFCDAHIPNSLSVYMEDIVLEET